jgi:hypothetical protein
MSGLNRVHFLQDDVSLENSFSIPNDISDGHTSVNASVELSASSSINRRCISLRVGVRAHSSPARQISGETEDSHSYGTQTKSKSECGAWNENDPCRCEFLFRDHCPL